MFFLTSYGEDNFGPQFKPEVHVKVPQPKESNSRYAFVLADEAKVRIQSSPKPELVGKEGLWGFFREKLQRSNEDLHDKKWLEKEERISVEVFDPLWRCVTAYGKPVDPQYLMVDLEIWLKNLKPIS